jgi:hypothetical protein
MFERAFFEAFQILPNLFAAARAIHVCAFTSFRARFALSATCVLHPKIGSFQNLKIFAKSISN